MSEFNNIDSVINIYESNKYPDYVMGDGNRFLDFEILYLIYRNDIEKAKKEFQYFIDSYTNSPKYDHVLARMKFIELTLEEIKKGIDKEKIMELIKQMNAKLNKD